MNQTPQRPGESFTVRKKMFAIGMEIHFFPSGKSIPRLLSNLIQTTRHGCVQSITSSSQVVLAAKPLNVPLVGNVHNPFNGLLPVRTQGLVILFARRYALAGR